MRRADITRIIKQGSVRQKIKLYFTDIALTNVDSSHIILSEDSSPAGTKLLSEKEKHLLWSSIKEPKDVKYYENLRTWNGAFLMFKAKFSLDLMKLQAIYYLLGISNEKELERSVSRDLVNDILDLIPDKKTREKALNKAIEVTKESGGREYQEKGYPKYLDIERSFWWDEIKKPTEIAIGTAKSCKLYLTMFKTILSTSLPLKPYIEWVNDQEDHLKEIILEIYNTTVLDDCPTDFPKIELYEDMEAYITDEDVNDFKTAGI